MSTPAPRDHMSPEETCARMQEFLGLLQRVWKSPFATEAAQEIAVLLYTEVDAGAESKRN